METCVICGIEIAVIGEFCAYCYKNYVEKCEIDEPYDTLQQDIYDFDNGD